MRILKTYARVFVTDLDTALPIYERLAGAKADLRFAFENAELAAVGDFLLIAGHPEDVEQYRNTVGPVIVDDLDALLRTVTAYGAELTAGPFTSATGTFVYVRHVDGAQLEYVQWSPETRALVRGVDHCGAASG
ncbi:VOC family protein [Nocardia sp. NPDC057455]|uniref:VOC family protein n=1 Tax=Nocardia sp. NPDC057455 TaxID=3346138 RepID=UPI0036716A36